MALWSVVLSGGTISSPPTPGSWCVEFSGRTISETNNGKMIYLYPLSGVTTTTTTTTAGTTTTTTTIVPYIVDSISTLSTGSSNTTASFPSTTTLSGDVAILTCAANPTGTKTFSTPAGWSVQGSDNSNDYITYRIFTKNLSGGEQNTSFTITTTVPDVTARLAVITIVRNHSSQGSLASNSPTISTSNTFAGTVTSPDLLVQWAIFGANSPEPDWTDTDFTLEGDYPVTGGNGVRIVVHYTTSNGNSDWETSSNISYCYGRIIFYN